MSSEHQDRRSTDPLIIEIHGMMKAVVERVDNHITWDKEAHASDRDAVRSVEERVRPLESFKARATAYSAIILLVLSGFAWAIGTDIWERMSNKTIVASK